MTDSEFDDDKTRTHVVLIRGTMVSHYQIVEKIGAGGMGEVYLAEDTKLHRKVALKFLPAQYATDVDLKARFVREAEAMAKLNHPNIITIFEVSEHRGQPFFAMELVEGQSLRDLAKSKELSIDRIIELAIQICDGMGAAHDKNIVHRDIKPSNIVIDAYGRPKILDFGLAAIRGAEQITKTGSTLGTVRYMSPEQVEGKTIDQRSDLFSVGIVLYELIAGRTPFERDNEGATLKAITTDSTEPLARYKSRVPDELQRTISKLLEKDPSMRYQTASGVISDLKPLIVSSSGQVSTTTARKRLWMYFAAAAVLIAGAFGFKEFYPDRANDSSSANSADRIMIAALPFKYIGPDEHSYLADAVTEEITSRLAAVRDLGVISRTSTDVYKNADLSIFQIASELGVDYILDGSVQWSQNSDGTQKLRIIPQLIRISDDTHIWSARIDRNLDDLFKAQSEIAMEVIRQLNVTLFPSAFDGSIQNNPTSNLEAYQEYLKGLYYIRRPDPYLTHEALLAVEMFERAVRLDSNFALAYAELSIANTKIYSFGQDRSPNRLLQARSALNRARELQSDLPEVHLASGYFAARCERDYQKAMAEFNLAHTGIPNDTRVLAAIARSYEIEGKFDEAGALRLQAYALDPRDSELAHEIADIYLWTRNYKLSERYFKESIALDPDQIFAYACLAENYWLWKGADGQMEANVALDEMPSGNDDHTVNFWFRQELFARRYDSALSKLNITEGKLLKGPWWLVPKSLMSGLIFSLKEMPERARLSYDSAVLIMEQFVEENPDDGRGHGGLGLALASVGRADDAVREAKLGVELDPYSNHALHGMARLAELATVYVIVGQNENALELYDYLLSIPTAVSISILEIDPRLDKFRELSGYKALARKYSTNM